MDTLTNDPIDVILSKLPYAETLVASLILYARMNAAFGNELKRVSFPFHAPFYRNNRNTDGSDTIEFRTIGIDIGIILPDSEEAAIRRTNWLVKKILGSETGDNKRATALLSGWAEGRVHEGPKQIVVGFVVVAVPGITMGRFKIKNSLTLITEEKFFKNEPIETAKTIARANLQFAQNAFNDALGNAKLLEPEISDWFFGDQRMDFYETSAADLEKILRMIGTLSIPYALVENSDGTRALAISPAANTEFLGMHTALTPLLP